jgi:hypothetical protein
MLRSKKLEIRNAMTVKPFEIDCGEIEPNLYIKRVTELPLFVRPIITTVSEINTLSILLLATILALQLLIQKMIFLEIMLPF